MGTNAKTLIPKQLWHCRCFYKEWDLPSYVNHLVEPPLHSPSLSNPSNEATDSIPSTKESKNPSDLAGIFNSEVMQSKRRCKKLVKDVSESQVFVKSQSNAENLMKAMMPADEINHPRSNMPTINEAQMKGLHA